jgi:hypothetical protein
VELSVSEDSLDELREISHQPSLTGRYHRFHHPRSTGRASAAPGRTPKQFSVVAAIRSDDIAIRHDDATIAAAFDFVLSALRGSGHDP